MASGGATLLLCALFSFFSAAHLAPSCPELVSCMGDEADPGGRRWRPCGDHLFRCNDSSIEIKFRGADPPFKGRKDPSPSDTLKLEMEDPVLSHIFADTDCDFLYSFPRPWPLFTPLPPSTPPPDSLLLQSYCNKESDYSVLFSELIKGYQLSRPCSTYDLYCKSKEEHDLSEDPALGRTCQLSGGADPPDPVLMWKLSLDYNSGSTNFNIVSVGFSRRHLLDPSCFNCRMTGGRCDSASPGYYTCGTKGGTVLKKKIILGLIVGISGFLLPCVIILLCCHYKKHSSLRANWVVKSRNSKNVEAFLEQYGTIVPKRYGYAEVKKITKSFTEKLGQGGYGTVFKGKFPNGQLAAVKVFKSKESAEEFTNEVASISRTHHVNIVSLLGFCCEGSKRALLYEFMPNGSLEKFIFFRKSGDHATHLGWEKLLEIAIGIARGLEYLHRGCKTRIVHFDIKPHNILLDEDFCPKISDFGLAKSCRPKQSILSTMDMRGTIGYIAPEVFSRNFGAISGKSDVYSYGMMTLEMVGGRTNVVARADSASDIYFPHWIYEHFNDNVLQLCDITDETEEIARKMILVGLWCIQTSPSSRPSMSKVLEMLEGNLEDLQMPPKPYMCSP